MRGHIKVIEERKFRLVFDGPPGPKGQRKQRTVTFIGTRRQAEAKLTELLNQVDRGDYLEPTKLTVAELLDKYMDLEVIPNSAPNTITNYGTQIRLRLKAKLGHISAQKLTALHIQEAYAAMIKDGTSPSVMRIVHNILRSALKRAVVWGVARSNVAELVEVAQPSPKRKLVPDEQTTLRIMGAIRKSWMHLPILLGALAGLRRGEILALRWTDVDLENRVLHVEQAYTRTRGEDFLTAPKRGSTRDVPLPDLLVTALRKHHSEQKILSPYVFHSKGRLRNPGCLTNGLRNVVKRMGLQGITPHSLRHTYASVYLESGGTIEGLREMLGHASIGSTQTYVHRLTAAQVITDRMNDRFTGKQERKKGTS